MTARARAALGSLVFLVVIPGVVAGAGPWLLTRWESSEPPLGLRTVGVSLVFRRTVAGCVRLYEEPTLSRRFGAE